MRFAIIGLAMTGLLAGCGGNAEQQAGNGEVAFNTSSATVGTSNGSEMTAIDASVSDATRMPADSGYLRPPAPAGGNHADAPKAARTVVADEAVTDDADNAAPATPSPTPSAS